jgi:hypothetical protein
VAHLLIHNRLETRNPATFRQRGYGQVHVAEPSFRASAIGHVEFVGLAEIAEIGAEPELGKISIVTVCLGAGPRAMDTTGLAFVELVSKEPGAEPESGDPWGNEVRVVAVQV